MTVGYWKFAYLKLSAKDLQIQSKLYQLIGPVNQFWGDDNLGLDFDPVFNLSELQRWSADYSEAI